MTEAWLVAGRILGAHGIRGWVRVKPFTDPPQNLLDYRELFLHDGAGRRSAEIDGFRAQGKGYVLHLRGVEDRDAAEALRGAELTLRAEDLPAPGPGEYYWHQLVGLRVRCLDGAAGERDDPDAVDIGFVREMLETGAHDVLVVAPDAASVDGRERLIPCVFGQVVERVALEEGTLYVRWFLDG